MEFKVLVDFLNALRQAGLSLNAREVAEVLWLARHIVCEDQSEQSGKIEAQVINSTAIDESLKVERPSRATFEEQPRAANFPDENVVLSVPDADRGDGTDTIIRVPTAGPLPRQRLIARALLPLKKNRLSTHKWELDPNATIDRYSSSRVWIPICRRAPERWIDLALIVDVGRSMDVWLRSLSHLHRLLTRAGVFRSVSLWSLDTSRSDTITLHAGLSTSRTAGPVRQISELFDPRGERTVLLATDCVSAAWHSGVVARTLRVLGSKQHVALLQVLPRSFWVRTGLKHHYDTKLHASSPRSPNVHLATSESIDGADDFPAGQCNVPIPVVTLNHAAVRAWASMMAGRSDVRVHGVFLEPTFFDVLDEELDGSSGSEQTTAHDRVERFRSLASERARHLASRCAVATALTLPVIRMLGETMEPAAEIEHMAEVLLGGLLCEAPFSSAGVRNPENVVYKFHPGVRERLLEFEPLWHIVETMHAVTRFIARETGSPINFEAVLKGEMPDLQPGTFLGNIFTSVTPGLLRTILPSEPISPAQTLANRYDLPTSMQGNGHTWEVWDKLEDRRVVVRKLSAPSPGRRAAALREIAILRRARIVGVARFYDEWVEDDQLFLVTEFVEGTPFPGRTKPIAWNEVAPTVFDLLDTIEQVHSAGLLHRNLKPSSVLVRPDGRPIVVDFGTAWAHLERALSEEASDVMDTRYVAPELFELDQIASPRSDLFSIGCMLYEALSGKLPFKDSAVRLLRLDPYSHTTRAIPLRTEAPHVPKSVAVVIDAMLEINPLARPVSAAEVRGVLGVPPERDFASKGPNLPPSPSVEDLKVILDVPDRLYHLATDAAHVLHTEGGGDRKRILLYIDRWKREGLAHWNDSGRLVIKREALDLFSRPLSIKLQAQIDALGAAAEKRQVQDVIMPALSEARLMAEAGRLGMAETVLSETVLGIRRLRVNSHSMERVDEQDLLALWIEVAMAEGTPQALARVQYEIGRGQLDSEFRSRAEALINAVLTVGLDNPRAKQMAGALPPFEISGLERSRRDVLVRAARGVSMNSEEATVTEAVRWAEAYRDPRMRAASLMWRSRLDYRRGAFESSARLAEEATLVESWASARLGAMWYAASSWLEAFEFRRARALARKARIAAADGRHPVHEARAELVERMASYRLGEHLELDASWVDAVASLGIAPLEAGAAMHEAVLAWRAGKFVLARNLATRAEQNWRSMRHDHPADLARCLALACHDSLHSENEGHELFNRVVGCDIPGLGIQSLALLAVSKALPQGASSEQALEQALQVPRPRWEARMDILSVCEALAILKVDDTGGPK